MNLLLLSATNLRASLARRFAVTPRTPSVGGGPQQRFAYVDALRGIAACGVLVYHFVGSLIHNYAPNPLPGPIAWCLGRCNSGVEIFFVLSGFVIAYSVRQAQVTPQYVGRFVLRRSLRLDPLYWAAILIAFYLVPLPTAPERGPIGAQASTLLVNALYLDQIVGVRSVVGVVAWTLRMEVQLYLLFIVLLGLSQRLDRRFGEPFGRLFVFAPILGYSLLLGFEAPVPAPWRGLCLGDWYVFFLGVVASWVVFEQVSWRWLAASLLSVGAAFCYHPKYRAAAATATAVSLVVVAWAGRLPDLLNWRWLQYLGSRSYSLYLFHAVLGWPFINFMVRSVGGRPSFIESVALFVAAVAVSIGAAEFFHRLVERPSLLLSRRIRLQPEGPVTTAKP
jgi:peptidoglycan/LPS O-acetylase OafA/YrhL